MKLIKPLLTALLANLIAFNTLADTRDINGVKVEDKASVNGTAPALKAAGSVRSQTQGSPAGGRKVACS